MSWVLAKTGITLELAMHPECHMNCTLPHSGLKGIFQKVSITNEILEKTIQKYVYLFNLYYVLTENCVLI